MKAYAIKLQDEIKAQNFQFKSINETIPLLFKQSELNSSGKSKAEVMLAISNDHTTAIRFANEQPGKF